ncbi:conserved Plasmodium protein, unknown function [Plasmodium gallinaceum]|uniref:Deubiquitinating enzyme MINDY-3/4 conserved domain-containing protein n=1 Tax=Plasmodium gallinaceum TaxID=5849 RepID=A0A1J1GS62_PLAGA|nr:conserved Plasmodium protein, unknown function [Plasmodium gallinaceum]CRG93883.1 conserved Plasmodium protein, unknown function [Plasmodium gallinaceum]
MKTNEELIRKEEEDISKTIALSLAEYNASQKKNNEKNYELDDENDELLQEAIRLSILGCKKSESKSIDFNDSYYDIIKKHFNKITYYLCNSYESTKNQNDIIDNKLFWKDIYKNYKNIYVIIRDYLINLNKRNEKLNEESSDSTSSRDDYESDDSSDCSNSSSLSCCSLERIRKTYRNINYTTKDYCKWLRRGNRSKCLNDHVYLSYLLKEMKLLEDVTSVHNLVFGVNNYKYANKLDIKKWCNHNLSFYENKNINFGLRQFLSGPCGLISSIQGYIIIILLFNYKYNFLWENNYFNILKTNNDFLNFTNNNVSDKKSSDQVNNNSKEINSKNNLENNKENFEVNGTIMSEYKNNSIQSNEINKENNINDNSKNVNNEENINNDRSVKSDKNMNSDDNINNDLNKNNDENINNDHTTNNDHNIKNDKNKNNDENRSNGDNYNNKKPKYEKDTNLKGHKCKNNFTETDYDTEFLQLVRDNIRDLKYYSLVESLAYILYQCTDKSYYIIAFLLPECYDYYYYMNKKNSDENVIRDLKKINIYYKEFSGIKEVIKFYLEHFIIFSSSTGVISFLYSVILTRGINNIKNDMDDINHPLIGIYGHCSQELVNLLLTGRACSNVFDNNSIINTFSNNDADICMYESSSPFTYNLNESKGSKNFNSQRSSFSKNNIVLKGINKRPLIGLLTDFEAFKYCEVGNFYKYPIYPIWVISSSNHYTVLFSLNIHNSKCTSEELFLEKLNKIWKKYDKENNKYILSHFIPQFLEDLNLKEEYKNIFDSFVNDLDILLYSEFKSFYLQMKQKDINDLKYSDPPKEKYFYLYDAQEAPEKSIHYFLLKEVDYDVSHENHLKFFNTRWPNNTVEILNIEKKISKHKYSY